MKRTRKLVVGGVVLLAFGIIATLAIRWDQHDPAPTDPAAVAAAAASVAASEAAKARSELPTTTPSIESPSSTDSVPPMPAVLTDNPIYRVGKLPRSQCPTPRQPATSVANLRAFYGELLGCLNRAWAPLVRKAGYTFRPPPVVIVDGTKPCGLQAAYYYCDGTIYLNAEADVIGWKTDGPDKSAVRMTEVFSHEYGHHLQQLAGIGDAWYAWGNSANGLDLPLQAERRKELQADCLGAVYVAANQRWSAGQLRHWQSIVSTFPDKFHDHGSTANARTWSLAGFRAADPGACNTFAAAPSRVS